MPEPAKTTPAPRPIGKVGKYKLKAILGQGGHGDVHLGVPLTGPNVAVKVLNANASRDADTVTRFKREADTAQRLEHPSIVRILDVGSARGRHYIIMELVRGGSLRRLLDRDTTPPDRMVSVLAEVAAALTFAHEQGVVHRDVKPENVLLTRAGRAKITDFGLARAIDQSSLTTEGRLMGTAIYMSPEQVRGHRATTASDVYAMGVILYEAITGARPFNADSQLGYLYQHAEVEPPRPIVRPGYPAMLARLALACLAKDPGDRPSMAEVAERLTTTWQKRARRRRRVRLAWVAILLLAILCGGMIAMPSVLDPLCSDWVGAPAFRWARRNAQLVHTAVWPEPARPHARPRR